jgi:polyhydroxyalkanoate synthesis regulator phasin
MAKEVIIKLTVPDWIEEKKIKEQLQRLAEELIAPMEQNCDEARRFFEVSELREEIEVPKNLEKKLSNLRRKRTWLSSTPA